MQRERSELLELLNQRYKELGLGEDVPYRVPLWTAQNRATHERTARMYAEANRSDPFAAARMRLHLARGLENANEITRDAHSALAARGRAIIPIEHMRVAA